MNNYSNNSGGGEKHRAKILVVDDDNSLRETLRIILQTSFNVTTVPSVDAAMEELSLGSAPQGIVMDMNMPNKDGIQGLKEICPAHPGIPILMLTGYADDETTEEALKLGASQLMRKPFDLVQLVTNLTEMIDQPKTPTSKEIPVT